MDLEEQGNGSIAGESASPNSNYGDVDNEADLSRSEESEIFVNSDGNIAAVTRISRSPSIESASSAKRPSDNTSPVMFAPASTEVSPQSSITKHSSKSSSPGSDVERKTPPKTVREESSKQMERLHVKTEEGHKSHLVSKLSPKTASFESPKAKTENNQTDTNAEGENENPEDCTCWRRPLLDQIFITDVTSNLVTVTVRESYTDKGFFRKRT